MRKHRWLIPAILILILISSLIGGYREKQLRQKLQNRAEGQYQKAFHELTWHLDEITGQLAQNLISTSPEQKIMSLAALWRQAFAAQANIGGLPLALVPLSQTENFLNNVSTAAAVFLSQVAEQDQAQEAERVKTIEVLYERARALAADLNQLGAKILREELSWTAVEMEAYAADEKLEDNTIVNGFRLLEKNMAEYPEINLASDFAQFVPDKVIESEREISLPEAEKKAVEAWFLKGNNKEAKVIYEGVGDVPTFGVEITSPEDNDLVYVDVSKIDGTMIWGMQVKEITQSKLTLKEGEEIALRFLKVRDFPPFEVVKAQKEDHTGVYTLVPRQNKVLLYPDQVKIQVALDEGTVIGFEGTPYYLFHKKRDFPEVQLQPQAIKELLNPRLKVELIQLALIIDASGKEVLTWEVRGSFAEEKFAVFFDAQTGREIIITRITPPAEFTFGVVS